MCGRFTHSYTRGSTTAFVGWPFPILGLDNSLAFRYVSWPEGYLHPFRVIKKFINKSTFFLT
jgi:hypothetical protein